MAIIDQAPDELEKLLADVQRTIRENDLFIRSLKKEAADSTAVESDEEDDVGMVATENYEEL